MIESKVLKSVLNNDHHGAYKLWKLDEKKCRQLISQSKLKNNFLRLLSLNTTFKMNGLQDYLAKEEIRLQLKNSYAIKLSKDLNRAKVKHIIIKGPAISRLYYDNQWDRNFSDIDILISLEEKIKFYKFLDENKLNHKNNIEFIGRIGYNSTAIEVIDTGEYLVDFHYRVISKFYKSECNLTKDLLCNIYKSNEINHTSHELNLAVIIYHACVHNSYRLDPYYLVDFDKINNLSKLNKDKLSEILNKYNLKKHYFHCRDLIEKIRSDALNMKESKKLFSKPKYLKSELIKSHINQFIDPAPYMNIKTGKRNFNYFSFLRTKFRGVMKKLG